MSGLRVLEPAPARRRIGALSAAFLVAFAIVAVRATQLALSGAPTPPRPAAEAPLDRADLIDRNGLLLAATVPAFDLFARPADVVDPDATAAALASALPGVDLRPTRARIYPQGRLAAHALGAVDHELAGSAGLERGLNEALQGGGPAIATSLDVRLQYALEAELRAALARHQALAAAAVLLDGKTGEVLALASLPDFDPNAAPPPDAPIRRDRVLAARIEPGSLVKPFVFAAALEAGVARADERFDTSGPRVIAGVPVRDLHPLGATAGLSEALAHSSNLVAAELAVRLGRMRLSERLAQFGLFAPPSVEIREAVAGTPPDPAASIATIGYGYGFTTTLIALAEAYSVFCNDGARVAATLLRVDPDAVSPPGAVISPASARLVLGFLRATAQDGSAAAASASGVAFAGKTGTAEKLRPGGGYDPDRTFAAFAGVFPADAPRYVLVLALDEPQRSAASGGLATGGATAAPAAGRYAARIAPFLGIEPATAAKTSSAAPKGDAT